MFEIRSIVFEAMCLDDINIKFKWELGLRGDRYLIIEFLFCSLWPIALFLIFLLALAFSVAPEEAHAAFIIIRIVYGELRRKIFKFAREWIDRVEVPESQAIDRMTTGLIKAPNIILWLQAEEWKQ